MLVDVREPTEVAQVSIDLPGIIYMPMSELEQRYTELPKDQQLIMVCTIGQRSLKATLFLMYHGYSQVANMEEGLAKWARKGLPVKGQMSTSTSGCSPSGMGTGCCDTVNESPVSTPGACCPPAAGTTSKSCC